MITLLHEFYIMNDLYAIVPASAIILIIAIRKILAPVKFNEEIFGEIHPDEVNNAASMRMMIGAGFGGIGLMGLMLGSMLEAGEATTSLLYALAAAYGFMLATFYLQIKKDICMRFQNHHWSFSQSCQFYVSLVLYSESNETI